MADTQIPEELRYTREDEWLRSEEDGRFVIGITDYAQDQLGDIVFVELPEVGATLEPGATFGSIESVKAVSDLYAPVAGEVVAVNEALADRPEAVNEDCYGEGWMIAVRCESGADLGALLDANAYRRHIAERSD